MAGLHSLPGPARYAAPHGLFAGQVPQWQGHFHGHPVLGLLPRHHDGLYKLPLPPGNALHSWLLRGHDRPVLRCLYSDLVAPLRADHADQLLERHERCHSYDWQSVYLWIGTYQQ